MCVVLFPVSLRDGILRSVKPVLMDTSLLLAIFHLISQYLSIVLLREGQLWNVKFNFLSARCIRWPGFVLITVSCHYVVDVVLLG